MPRLRHDTDRAAAPARRAGELGQVIPLVAVFIVTLLVFVGMVVDFGNAYRVRQALRASTDAAATAGGDNLPDPTLAVSTAHNFGSETGAKNQISGVTNVSMNAVANCDTGPNWCTPANTLKVTQTAHVKTFFLGLVGINDIPITVSAQACSPCDGKPLDVQVVIDRSGSMSGQKIQNAKDGINAMLTSLNDDDVAVGLTIFAPPSSVANRCNSVPSNPYDTASYPYTVVPLSQNYKNADGTLNTNSTLVSTINCIKAGGSTAYANALDAAKAELDAHGRANVDKVIILMSDGAANTGPAYLAWNSPYRLSPCHQAINEAAADKAAGVTVYSIAYDLGGTPQYCQNDVGGSQHNQTQNESPSILATSALQQIASPGDYYANPNPTDLTSIFLAIAGDMMKGTSRLNQ
jgi:Flp pilus assembly protein TadG